jgi:hypothetical protein
MTVERIAGGWLVAEVIDGYRVSARYFGYSKRRAISLFRAEYYR